MSAKICLYSKKKGELEKFLNKFYNTTFNIHNDLKWEKMYSNPVELAEIVGTFIDNSDNFEINMWICLDKNLFIHVGSHNGDEIIKYLYERYPW